MTAAIQFDHVTKRFNMHLERPRSFQELVVSLFRRNNGSREEFWALRDVSFSIEPGEVVGFIGSNGVGKSTILKLISRIISPTSGKVSVRGQISALLELGAGFHPDLTGRENIYLNGSILGLSHAQIRQNLDAIVSFAELERFIDVPVKHYSSGMYVRLGFSIAVHTNPEILLVDEALAVGDQNFQHKCLERITKIKQQGATICFVSHDLGTVGRLCSHAIWLDGGAVQAAGKVDDTISAYLHHAADEEEMQSATLDQAHQAEPQNKQRWGTQEVEIVAVSCLDADGKEKNVFEVGETWIVRLRYRVARRVESPIFGIAIHRDDGLHICGPNTHFAGQDLPFVEGEGELCYRVDHLPLMEGLYLLSAAAVNQADTIIYDYHDRLYSFKVRQVGRGERFGLMSMGGNWERNIREAH